MGRDDGCWTRQNTSGDGQAGLDSDEGGPLERDLLHVAEEGHGGRTAGDGWLCGQKLLEGCVFFHVEVDGLPFIVKACVFFSLTAGDGWVFWRNFC